MSAVRIRPAHEGDLPGILAIFNDVVLNTTAIWHEKPADLEARRVWMAHRRAHNFPIFVAEREGHVAAFASYNTWRSGPCYFPTVEHSVHVHRDYRHQGLGSALVERLMDVAREQKKHVMIAATAGDNAASRAFHKKLGFSEVGYTKQVGFKFGQWLDLVFLQKML